MSHISAADLLWLVQVLELIPVQYPEPEEECLEGELAELGVECSHHEEEYCVQCAHIRDSGEVLTADKVTLLGM